MDPECLRCEHVESAHDALTGECAVTGCDCDSFLAIGEDEPDELELGEDG